MTQSNVASLATSGHDGKTGCGAKFTNIRVVCQNTLTAALSESGAHSSITHKNGANNNFDALISSIDVARQDFVTECELMREFSRRSMGINAFSEFINEVYNVEENQVFRKREKLNQAFFSGYGSDFAPMSVWAGINAITQVETSSSWHYYCQGSCSVRTWHLWCWRSNQQESFCCC